MQESELLLGACRWERPGSVSCPGGAGRATGSSRWDHKNHNRSSPTHVPTSQQGGE